MKEIKTKWYAKNREKALEKQKAYYNTHKEQYSKYYNDNSLEKLEYQKEWNDKHKDTMMYRAGKLLQSYNKSDIKRGFCVGDLTARWIVENIFTKPCAHCGETDWHKLGCNRIDNSKPHTMDNVESCCYPCNLKCLVKELERDESGRFTKLNKGGC